MQTLNETYYLICSLVEPVEERFEILQDCLVSPLHRRAGEGVPKLQQAVCRFGAAYSFGR